MRTYAGIGSRQAPKDVIGLCRHIGVRLYEQGHVLRSGHAIGCDQAFEDGGYRRAQIFLPWKDYEADHYLDPTVTQVYKMPTIEAIQMVEEYHPTPERLSMASVRFHARNCHILLGPGLDDPVERVVCWTLDENRGGTSFGIRVARELGIKVNNLADPFTRAGYEALT